MAVATLRLVLGLAVVRHADALQATGSRSGARPTRGYSVDLAERASTSTAFFEPEPGLNEEGEVVRVRGVFEPDDPKDMTPVIAEDYWEPYINSPRMDSDHLSPDRLRSSDLNELLQPDFMEIKRFGISPMQARHALALPCHTHRKVCAKLWWRGWAARSPVLDPCLTRVCGQAIGAVFKDETVLSGMDELNKEAWRAVAKFNNLPPPDDDHMELAMGAPLPLVPSTPARTALPAPGRDEPDAHRPLVRRQACCRSGPSSRPSSGRTTGARRSGGAPS